MTADPVAAEAFRRLRAHVSPAAALAAKFAGQGAVEASAEGCHVTLSDGRRLLDFGSYAVTLLGHRHPDVVAAVAAQLDTMPVSTRSLTHPAIATAGEAVVDYLGRRLPRVYFGTNGADAVEVAVKLARLATGRTAVLAVRGAYHGKSMGALALTWHPRFRRGLETSLGHVVHADPEDRDAVARAVAHAGSLAAIVFEPIQGENGVVPLDMDVLSRWTDDAHAHGALVIADEIQVGLRRAGPRSVSLDAGLPVDAVLLGKPLGGGVMPVSAAVCGDALYRPLVEDPFRHTATFAAQPLAMAAVPVALSAIEVHSADGAAVSGWLAEGLQSLRRYPDTVTAVRGRGLIWGVDFTTAEHAGEVAFGLAERGLIVSPCLSRPETLRLLPPMVATRDDVAFAVEAVTAAVAAADRTLAQAGAAS